MSNRIDTAAEREKLAALQGYTPGPWDNSGPGDLVGTMIDDRYEWSCIAIIGEVDRHHKSEKTANANLIAAAPELHSALTAALDEIDASRAENKSLREALRDVIAMLDDPTGDEHVRDMRGATVIARAALKGEGP